MKELSVAKRKIEAETEAARDVGRDYFRTNPEATMGAVMHEADRRYGANDLHRYWGFYEGFQIAHAVHDEYLRDKREFESKL